MEIIRQFIFSLCPPTYEASPSLDLKEKEKRKISRIFDRVARSFVFVPREGGEKRERDVGRWLAGHNFSHQRRTL